MGVNEAHTVIRGKRVLIRPLEDDDQEFLTHLANDPGVRANVVGWDFPQSIHNQAAWFAGHRETSTRRWIITDLEGHRLGLTGLWDIDWHDRVAEIAIKLGGSDDVRGKGYGSDALLAIMAFAFYDMGLERLDTRIIATNGPSLTMCTDHLGFRHEGVARERVWRHGKRHDLVYLGALRSDFDALAQAPEYVSMLTRHAATNLDAPSVAGEPQ